MLLILFILSFIINQNLSIKQLKTAYFEKAFPQKYSDQLRLDFEKARQLNRLCIRIILFLNCFSM